MSTRPKPIAEEEPSDAKKERGVKTAAVEEDDPFAEFHDGWEPVRKRKHAPPTE